MGNIAASIIGCSAMTMFTTTCGVIGKTSSIIIVTTPSVVTSF